MEGRAALDRLLRSRADQLLGWLRSVDQVEAAVPEIALAIESIRVELLLLQQAGPRVRETDEWRTKESAVANQRRRIASLEDRIRAEEGQGRDASPLRRDLDEALERLRIWMERQVEELVRAGPRGAAAPAPRGGMTPERKQPWSTEENIRRLAVIIMSEASTCNQAERTAVGYTVLNRMARNGTNAVADVEGAYARNQQPTEEIIALARGILSCNIPDNSGGATHFYSPRSMPHEGDQPLTGDTAGGLEQTPGEARRNYRPGWANTFEPVEIPGVVARNFRFFRAPGDEPVR
jgi:predicted RNase H-like nuclease (RuvC/YqgF family)